jgi:hypothetical protein
VSCCPHLLGSMDKSRCVVPRPRMCSKSGWLLNPALIILWTICDVNQNTPFTSDVSNVPRWIHHTTLTHHAGQTWLH